MPPRQGQPPRPTTTPPPANRAPLWLRGLILFVVVWLGVRIVGNVTDSLRGMAGHAPVPTPTTEPALR